MSITDFEKLLSREEDSITDETYPISKVYYSKEWALECMKEVYNQALELAARKAEIEIVDWEDNSERIKSLPALPIYGIDEESILKLKII